MGWRGAYILRAMTGPSPRRAAPDPDRTLLRVTGADRVKFLQRLVTNDLNRLAREGILYAALLTPQGKYLCDFFLLADGEAILIDAPAAAAQDLLHRLMLYRLRAEVAITPDDRVVIRGLGDPPAGAWPDPRDPAMGWRLYQPARAEGAAVDRAEVDRAEVDGAEVDWAALAVDRMVPVHGTDLVPEESYILELGFERLNGVDFRKGCYVGQEVTARMHNKTELRRGLVRVALVGPAEPGTPILTADGREAGRLGTVAGDRGLALLRLDRVGPGLTAAGAQVTPLD